MSFLDENDDKKATGGLSLLGAFQESLPSSQEDSEESPWGDIWKHRGGFSFSMKKGTRTSVVFLGDLKIIAATPLLVGWVNTGQYNFPKIDYVQSVAYSDSGEPTGNEDVISNITGIQPALIGVAPILDMTEWTDKEGDTHKYSIRHVLFKSRTVLSQLEAISKHHERSLTLAHMSVERSRGDKSAATGDVWFCKGFLEFDRLTQECPDLEERLSEIDLDLGFPVPDSKNVKRLLNQHIRVAKKNAGKKVPAVDFNEEAWAKYNGTPMKPQVKAVDDHGFGDLCDLSPTTTNITDDKELAKSDNSFDLGDLDSLL